MKPTAKDLEAVYNLSKHAKKYAERAEKYYAFRKGATAKKNSLRKEALYSVKAAVILDGGIEPDRVERHRINGDVYYCFYFRDENGQRWSFHVPADEVSTDAFECIQHVDGEKEIDDFERSSEKEHSKMTLKDALLHIYKRFDVNANDHLTEKEVYYGYRSYPVGWKYLGDGC